MSDDDDEDDDLDELLIDVTEPERCFIFEDGTPIELTEEQHARLMFWFIAAPETAGEA